MNQATTEVREYKTLCDITVNYLRERLKEEGLMKTTIYMVRHAESPYDDGDERTRGLTAKGKADAVKVTKLLSFVSIKSQVQDS